MKINAVAKLCGITVRTLHYYDQIGLLSPAKTTEAGYRIYDADDLERLQQILFFRELSFPLKQIKEIVTAPDFDRAAALENHLRLLRKKREHLDGLIRLVQTTQAGGDTMSFQEFDNSELEQMKQEYAEEAKQRWGATGAYAESERRTAQYTPGQWTQIKGEMEAIFSLFADLRGNDPTAQEAQTLVERWQQLISDRFYCCTNEMLAGLGQMYVQDARFRNNIDKSGQGTAEFISKAIKFYCKKDE